MKKTTFYTLLCTTIILPGTLLAAQQPEQGAATPMKAAKLKIVGLIDGAPKTPQLREQQEAIYSKNALLSPDSKSYFVDLGTEEARRKRDEDVQRDADKLLALAAQEKLKLALEAEEEQRVREKAEQEALVLKAREAAQQKQEANIALEKQITELGEEVEKLTQKLSSAAELKKLSADRIREMSEELRKKTGALAEAQEKLRESQNQAEIQKRKAARAEEGEKRLTEGLQAIIAEKKEVGGLPPVVVDPLPVQVPVGDVQPNADEVVQKNKKVMKKAHFGAQGDDKK